MYCGEGTLGSLVHSLQYNGAFEDNIYHGIGKLVFDNGDVFEGKFKKGKFWNGRSVENDDIRNGIIRATYKDGVKDGPATLEKKIILEQSFQNWKQEEHDKKRK